MKVSELGEFGLIELLAKTAGPPGAPSPANRQLILGIGDDAAAWRDAAGTRLATVDALIQGVHFSLETTPWRDLGWKSLAVNLSDIAAMGGAPEYALISLALPGDTEVADVTALYEGMAELARETGTVIAGGDTCQAPLVAISVTVTGRAGERLLTRAAAKPGELIAVTGWPGSAAAGLEMLSRGLRFKPEATEYLKKAFLRPASRLAVGKLLAEAGASACIDISDGLLADLRHICRASHAGARIMNEKIPLHPALAGNFGGRALELALAGGEDYELLFTASRAVMDTVQKAAALPLSVIGEVTADNPGEVTLLDAAGNPVTPPATGWEHFRQA